MSNESVTVARQPRWRSLARRGGCVLALVAFAMAVVVPASPASAHATLLFTSPTADGAVPESPPVVQLVFDQAVVADQIALAVKSVDGESVRLGAVRTGDDGSVVRAEIPRKLAPGEYRVEWQVVARDGDPMVGSFGFVVGSGSALDSKNSDTATPGAWKLATLRLGLFAGLALALGGLVGRRLTQLAGVSADAPRPWLRSGAGIALLSAIGLAVIVAGAGSALEGLDLARLVALVDSTPGVVALVEVAALAVALATGMFGRDKIAGFALLAVPVAEGFRAHPGVQAGVVGVLLVAVHLTAVAIWAGALLHVIRTGVALRRAGVAATPLVGVYARMALALFGLVVLTGALAAITLIPIRDLLDALVHTTYGRWLLAKLGVVVLVAVLAWRSRQHLRLRPAAAQPAASASYELGAIAVVLVASSILTSLAPPVPANIPLPAAPPDVGPAIGLGTRAGYVGIAVSASSGQLIVRLTPPTTVDTKSREPDEITLAGNIAVNTKPAETVEFRGCGFGCFVTPVTWAKGSNVITFRVDDKRWGGGRASVTVPWPLHSAERQLRSAVQRMRAVEHFTVHEQVTSDTATGLGEHTELRASGAEYLAAGPFGSGRAVSVRRYRQAADGEVTLALAYPAERTFVLLTIDRQDRIVREVLASGEHLVTRTLVYDEPNSHAGHDHTVG